MGSGGLGLFDQYADGASPTKGRRVGHSSTKTSRMRSQIIKVNCYLNGEADHGRAAVVKLPEECDTLGEVLPKIHKRLDLDKRIAYAAELFLPDGKKIRTYPELVDAAENDHAVIVTCGEAFDPTTIPYDLLEAYLHGGGRKAIVKVKQELETKQKIAAHDKADTVRSDGHGVYPNSAAVVTSRSMTVESNREVGAQMRHEYMEQVRIANTVCWHLMRLDTHSILLASSSASLPGPEPSRAAGRIGRRASPCLH